MTSRFPSSPLPTARRGLLLSSALTSLLVLGAVGCTVHVHGRGANDGGSSARSESNATANVNVNVHSDANAKGNVHAADSSRVNVKTSDSSRVSVKGRVSANKRIIFVTKPRVAAVSRAKTDAVFVGAHGKGTVGGSGKVNVSGSVHGSGKVTGSGNAHGNGKTTTRGDKSTDTKGSKGTETKGSKGTDTKGSETKTPTTDTGKKPVARPRKPVKRPQKPSTDEPTTPVEETPTTPVEETPTTPVETPIEPPTNPPDNVFGYDKPVRGCFEGLVYFIPQDSKALPKSYADLTSASAVYACEWDIPTRAWEQGFPGIEDRFEWFAIRYSGAFNVSQAGTWTFRLSSDDGTRLVIDDKLVIDNDGVHSPAVKTGTIDLAAGDHTMVLEYFQGPRYHINLQLFATPPGGAEGVFSVR